MLKLKLQYFGHLIRRADSLEKTLMLGKIEGRRRREQQRMRWLDGFIDSTDVSFRKLQETVKDKGVWCAAVHRATKSPTAAEQQAFQECLQVTVKNRDSPLWQRANLFPDQDNKISPWKWRSDVCAVFLISNLGLCVFHQHLMKQWQAHFLACKGLRILGSVIPDTLGAYGSL